MVQAAVGAAPGRSTINVSSNSYSSSLRTMTADHLAADPASAVIGTQDVEVVTVVDLVQSQGLDPRRALLKIDTQGFEAEVVAGAGDLLDSFAAVQLELSFVRLYEGQALFDDLVASMQGHGLSLWTLETGISGPNGRLLQCDGLFLRGVDHG